jgi:hypothetical protein
LDWSRAPGALFDSKKTVGCRACVIASVLC